MTSEVNLTQRQKAIELAKQLARVDMQHMSAAVKYFEKLRGQK